MTISIDRVRNDYSEVDSTGPFAFGFRVDDASDLVVIHTDDAGSETVLTADVDYTATGIGDEDGGYITLTTPLDTGENLTLMRTLPYLQEQEYLPGHAVTAQSLNDAFDARVMQIQQISERVKRCFSLPKHSLLTDLTVNPAADHLIGWDSSGTALVNYDNNGTVTVPEIDYIGNYDDLADAVTSIGSGVVWLVINAATSITGNLTVPVNITLVMTEGIITCPIGYTLTINSIQAGRRQVFSTCGTFKLPLTPVIYPEWFGFSTSGTADNNRNALMRACAAASNTIGETLHGTTTQPVGQVVHIGIGDFAVSTGTDATGASLTDVVAINANGVRVRGSGAGTFLRVTGVGRLFVFNTDATAGAANLRHSQWLSDMTIYHDGEDSTATTAIAVDMRGCYAGCGVTRCDIQYFAYGVYAACYADCEISACSLDRNGVGVYMPNFYTSAVPSNIRICDNIFTGCTGWGIQSISRWKDILIQRNSFTSVAATDGGISFLTGITSAGVGLTVANNYCSALPAGQYFFSLTDNSVTASHVSLIGNVIIPATGTHFYVARATGLNILNNYSGAVAGKAWNLGSSVSQVVISGNTLADETAVTDASTTKWKQYGQTLRGMCGNVRTQMLYAEITAETYPRFTLDYDGRLEWGGGSGSTDLALYRFSDSDGLCLRMGGGMHFRVDGAWDAGMLRMGGYFLWVDGDGKLRIHSGAPTSDTDGTIVGAQSA